MTSRNEKKNQFWIHYPFKLLFTTENNFFNRKIMFTIRHLNKVNGALRYTEINFEAHNVVCWISRLKHIRVYTTRVTQLFTIFFYAEFLSWPYKVSKPCNFQMIRAIIPKRDFSHRDKSTGIRLVMQNQNLSSPTAKKTTCISNNAHFVQTN